MIHAPAGKKGEAGGVFDLSFRARIDLPVASLRARNDKSAVSLPRLCYQYTLPNSPHIHPRNKLFSFPWSHPYAEGNEGAHVSRLITLWTLCADLGWFCWRLL